GKAMPTVASAVAGLDAERVAETIEDGGEVGINIEGKDHTLEPDDLIMSMEPVAGYQVESESGHAVALALELDDDLIREGLAREIVHAVQNARKEAGLEITDRIDLTLSGDPALLEAAGEHRSYLGDEVLANSISLDAASEEAAPTGSTATIEGRGLSIAVSRVEP
ncbi:MAG: DUF5915 domain-containing protein, partial [Acidobacteriota bacterium]